MFHSVTLYTHFTKAFFTFKTSGSFTVPRVMIDSYSCNNASLVTAGAITTGVLKTSDAKVKTLTAGCY